MRIARQRHAHARIRARRFHRRGQHSRLRPAPASAGALRRLSRRPPARPDRAASRFHGRLHARRPLSPALHAVDERDSRAGRRRQDHLRRLPQPSPEILGLASWLGVTHFFQMGGAQAIAALAFGTETVPRVDRIVGPGNIYVAAAKKLIAGETGIDFVAGPTEIVIIAAEGNPRWIAADMLAQAEHDVDASAILLTTSRSLAESVAAEVERQLSTLPTAAVARPSIEANGAIVIVDTLRPSRRVFERACAGASRPARCLASGLDTKCRLRVFGPGQPGSGGRLRLRPQPRAAHFRRGPLARRPFLGRFREGDFGAGIEARGAGAADARHHHSGSRRRSRSPRPLGRGPSIMSALRS